MKKLFTDCLYDIKLRIKTSYEMHPNMTLVVGVVAFVLTVTVVL